MRFEEPKLSPAWGCLTALIGVAVWVGIIVVAWHFIAKFW